MQAAGSGVSGGWIALIFGAIVVVVLVAAFVLGSRRKEKEPPPVQGPVSPGNPRADPESWRTPDDTSPDPRRHD